MGVEPPIVEVFVFGIGFAAGYVSAPIFPLDAGRLPGSGSVYPCLNNWRSSVATFLR